MTETTFSWQVDATHPAFAGHFPGRPIVPGVVLLDRALSFAARLLPAAPAGWQIGNTKFLQPVGPATLLHFHFRPQASGSLNFSITTDGQTVASGSLTPLAGCSR